MRKQLLTAIGLALVTFSASAQHTWTRTNPGGGGAIAVVGATKDNVIVVASDLSGIYRSTDNGITFNAVGGNQGLIETHVSALGFDPVDGDIFFAGSYTGLYKTSDAGLSFHQVFPAANNNFDYSYIEDIAIAKSNHNIGYVTHHISAESTGNVYKTYDGGETWNAVPGQDLPNDLRLVKLMVHPSNENYVYALSGKSRWGCGDADLFRSIDGGIHWTQIGDAYGDILDFDLHPTELNTVYISTFVSNYQNNAQCMELGLDSDEFPYYQDYLGGAFFKSTNGGTTFNEIGAYTGIISVGINDPNTIRLMDPLFPYEWNDNAGTWETTDGGTNWNQKGSRSDWESCYSINEYFTYAKGYNGLNKTITKDLFNSDRYFATFGQWAWASFDGGATLKNISTNEISPNHWRSTGVENIIGTCIDVNDNNPDVIYMGAYDIGFWYSTDHGDTWVRTQPNYNTYPTYSWDLGDAGTIPANMARRGGGSNVMTLVNDPMREGVVWASFSKEQSTLPAANPAQSMYAYTGLFKSTNYGEDWTLITNGLPSFNQSLYMYGLSLDVTSNVNQRTLYITVDGTVYKSTDDGMSWNPTLTGHEMKFTEVDKVNGQIVYAGGKNGLWRTINGGQSWNEIGTAAMHNSDPFTYPDINPTYTDWSGVEPVLEYQGVFDIQTAYNAEGKVYVTVKGPQGGVYRSTNAGNNWSNNLLPDPDLRGIALARNYPDIVYATSSQSYNSGGFGPSKGVQFSADGGNTWQDANEGMAYSYAGMIDVESGANPNVWAWSQGTGIQFSSVPVSGGITLQLKSFLYGPYNMASQNMSDPLRQQNLIPLTEPFTTYGFNHVMGGGETTTQAVLNISGTNAIVDWIMVELRDPASPTTILSTQSALIQRDGDIVSTDGVSPVVFNGVNASNVYVVLRHRNHFGVRTANTYPTNNTISVDFTNPNTPLFGTTNMLTLGNKRVMMSGDANHDGQINVIDVNQYWRLFNAQPFDYFNSKGDFDLNGSLNAIDLNKYWRPYGSLVNSLD